MIFQACESEDEMCELARVKVVPGPQMDGTCEGGPRLKMALNP